MAIVPILMIAAAAVSTYAAVKQGQAASQAADYNASAAQQQAAALQQQEQQASVAQKRDTALKLGTLSANQGASGLDPSNSTSSLETMSSSIQQSTLDNLNLKYNYQMKELGYSNSATLDTMASKNDTTAGYLTAAGTALGGAGGVAKYQAGVPVQPAGYGNYG